MIQVPSELPNTSESTTSETIPEEFEGSSPSKEVESAQISEDATKGSYAANLWPRNGDVFESDEYIRPSLTFDRVYDFSSGGHPLLQLIPLEGQEIEESKQGGSGAGCMDPIGKRMRDGAPPNYTTGCTLGSPGRWLIQVSWLPLGAEGDPFVQREFISSEIVVQ